MFMLDKALASAGCQVLVFKCVARAQLLLTYNRVPPYHHFAVQTHNHETVTHKLGHATHKIIKFHKSPSIKRLFDIELLNKKLLIVV